MSTTVKPGTNEVLSIGLGMISWIFPNIPTPIKIIITLLVFGIIIFMILEKQQRQKVAINTANLFNYYIIPGLAGALKYFFYTLIAFLLISILSLVIFNKPNIFTSSEVFRTSGTPTGFLELMVAIATDLNTLGYIIVIVAVIAGMAESIKQAKLSRPIVKAKGQP